MELDQGAHMDLGHGAGLVTSAGATERTELEREGDGIVNEKGADGEFSSGSSSSNASLHSCSTLAPISPSSPTVCAEEDKEMLTGCSKSFTGLKIFTRSAISCCAESYGHSSNNIIVFYFIVRLESSVNPPSVTTPIGL
ncbi:putative diacylglycerol kinase zeta-like [Scophthalmus maximus]|uniref:Putative diacylglycerol kinase zeta-like n=1 Tax=Scophthalmus maximus TaxID=52904 RepID=A0A2U9AW10_SCOMX|nr:putative diacylglycerol kinase zeta-like [Scophthalmus maximus]